MCGIFAMISKRNLPINKFLLNGLKQLQNRGYDSAGICTVSENSFEVIKYASENINAISKIEQQINNRQSYIDSNNFTVNFLASLYSMIINWLKYLYPHNNKKLIFLR